MKRTILGIALLTVSICIGSIFDVLAACGDTWQKYSEDTTSGSCDGLYWGGYSVH